MSGLLYAGFDYGTDDHLIDLWSTEATAVVVDSVGGRLAGAAFFDAELFSTLSAPLVWGIDAPTPAESFMGMAFRPVIIGGTDGITIAQLHMTTPTSTLRLIAYPTGAFVIRYDRYIDMGSGDEVVVLGQYVCGSAPGMFAMGQGCYVEWSVRRGDTSGANTIYLRVNGQVVGSGNVLYDNTEEFSTFTLGGGNTVTGAPGDEIGQWFIDDVYVLDGVPESVLWGPHGFIDNAGFLGDVMVQGLFATADGVEVNEDPEHTPWVPAVLTDGLPVHYNQINENPPDGGATNESTDEGGTVGPGPDGDTLDKYDTFKFVHPNQGLSHFGEVDPAVTPTRSNTWPLYAVQTVASVQGAAAALKATIRDVLFGSPSDDPVELGPTWSTDADYHYHSALFDRHTFEPFSTNPIWRMGNFFTYPLDEPLPDVARYPTEFGIAQVAAEGSADLTVFGSRVIAGAGARYSWALDSSPALTGSGVLSFGGPPDTDGIVVTAFITDPTNLIPDVPITSVEIHVTGAGSTTFNDTQNTSINITGGGTLGGGGGPSGPKSFGPTSAVYPVSGIFTRAALLAFVFGYAWNVPIDEGNGSGTGAVSAFFIRVTFGTVPVPVVMDQEVVEIVAAASLYSNFQPPDSPWFPPDPPPVPGPGDPGPDGGPPHGPGTGIFPPRVVTDQWQIHAIDVKPREEERA